VQILLITGSTRSASSNTAALRTVQVIAPIGVETRLFDGLAALPAFNPDDDRDPLPSQVVDLRQEISSAHAVLFCTPEYAGTLPGSFKNLLDWTVGGGQLHGKPVSWINVAAEGRGEQAQASLALVLSYVAAVAAPGAGTRLPVGREAVGADGLVISAEFRSGAISILEALAACAPQTP
jgi:chromate reductase